MNSVTFTNSAGESVTIGRYNPFKLVKITGTDATDAAIITQKAPYQDGSTYINTFLEERSISIELGVLGSSKPEIEDNKSIIFQVFNPKLGPGILRYEYPGGIKEIMATPEGTPTFPTKNNSFHQGIINLLAPNPYWFTEEQADQLVIWEGGLEFPLQLPTFFAELSQDKSKRLVNNGHVETPVQITFNGPATAPIRVENVTTGEFLEVNQDLLAGEYLEINTAFGNKKVVKVSFEGTTNAFNFINLESTFFQLVPGNNLIDYSTGADYEQTGVQVKWRNRYSGV